MADVAWWSDLVTGLPRPLIEDGYITVPDAPGLGFEDINEELFKKHLDPARGTDASGRAVNQRFSTTCITRSAR